MTKDYIEVNFDRLVGPTYHFGGYAFGNLASMQNKETISFPKKAALEGLNKMKLLSDLGIPQAVLPPPMRPSFPSLRALGFRGNDAEIFEHAAQQSPHLLLALSSSASIWMANSATFSPSIDTQDGKAHLTVANLVTHLHRSIESEETFRLFSSLFADEDLFTVHPPLPKAADFGDEGAANHTRFCTAYGDRGAHLFVYGKSFSSTTQKGLFPIRQTKEASQAVARLHRLDPSATFFIQQNPTLIDLGVIHNDVIATGNLNWFIFHEKAFIHADEELQRLQQCCPLNMLCVTEQMLTVKEAVQSYFFNGQLLALPSGKNLLLLPQECRSLKLDWLPFEVHFVDIKESMRGGGGPGCLRLRCVLNGKERKHIHPFIFLNETLYNQLASWIEKHYRDELNMTDLRDPLLLRANLQAFDELSEILHLDIA